MARNLLLAALACAVWPLVAAAEDKKKPDSPPDPAAAMEAMMKAATPGEMHKKLEPLAGSFDFVMKFWMDPSKPPVESKGTSEAKWVMGNRYLRQEVKGDFGGSEFHGVGVMGYDNLKKKYVYAWIDNMGTGIATATGEMDKTSKVLTFSGEEIDPLSGKALKSREVSTLNDDGTYKSEFYKLVGGKELKVMEINYTKKK
jgi:hypothetical protein